MFKMTVTKGQTYLSFFFSNIEDDYVLPLLFIQIVSCASALAEFSVSNCFFLGFGSRKMKRLANSRKS